MTATVPADEIQGRLSQYRRDGFAGICPIGGLDRALVDEVRGAALAARAPVIVDLRDAVLIDLVEVSRIAADWELYRPEMCVVCPGSPGRDLLRRADVDRVVAVFDDVEDAMTARAGGGRQAARWSPTGPS